MNELARLMNSDANRDMRLALCLGLGIRTDIETNRRLQVSCFVCNGSRSIETQNGQE